MNFFNFLKKILFKARLLSANEFTKAKIYADYFKIIMGDKVRITGKISWGSEPYLIKIGNDVTLANGVTFHNHDGGVSVLRRKYPGIDLIKPINLGNNIFVGSNTTIMPGVNIGNNVIIGASSVVTHNIPDNVVVAGVPAKIIKTLQEYEDKILKECVYIKSRSNAIERKMEIMKHYPGA